MGVQFCYKVDIAATYTKEKKCVSKFIGEKGKIKYIQQIRLENRHRPRKNLNIEFPIYRVCRNESQVPLNRLKLGMQYIHDGGETRDVHEGMRVCCCVGRRGDVFDQFAPCSIAPNLRRSRFGDGLRCRIISPNLRNVF